MTEKGKSSSDVDYPRITFHAPGRTFDRLLKEGSLADLKETVRKKLGLESGSMVQFAQLRYSKPIDLEDEDDFDAFCVAAYEQRYTNVQVILTENSAAIEPHSHCPTCGQRYAIPESTSPLQIAANSGQLQSKGDYEEPREAIDTSLLKKRHPEPLDLSNSRPPPTCLVLARPLKDLSTVIYPEGINAPKAELNVGAEEGKFRYDRNFLMQFMPICKEKPDSLPPLDTIGLQAVDRTRNRHVEKRPGTSKVAPAVVGSQIDGSAYSQVQSARQTFKIEPATPSQATENKWDREPSANNDSDLPVFVDAEFKVLLNKLTLEDFDSISDQIIQGVNKSENEKDGRTLSHVVHLVFEKAADEATWPEICAHLFRKMMEQISPKVQDERIQNSEGKPIGGGQLFRKYLLNKCREVFELGCFAKEATATTATEADGQIAKATESGEVALYSEEYHVTQNPKGHTLRLVMFIGELFKQKMLTERLMHQCIKKLLDKVQNNREEEIESLCKLLATVGSLLDTQKARAHLDAHFQRMQELSEKVSPQVQIMLRDVIELRERKWQAQNAVVGPTTVAHVHKAAVELNTDKETETTELLSMSHDGSPWGAARDDYFQPDGWNSVLRPTRRAGDLSQFGRISKTQHSTTFWPNNVFTDKKDPRTNSNMFSALQDAKQGSSKGAEPPRRKKLVLQPRVKPGEPLPSPSLTEEAADAKISEDVKKFFTIRNLDEAEVYFTALPSQHHHRLVNRLVSTAVESKEPDAVLVADLFTRINRKGLCSPDAFEEGLAPTAEIIEDIAIGAPKAWSLFATVVKGVQSDGDHQTRLATRTEDSDKLMGLLSDVIELREHKWLARNSVVAPTIFAQVHQEAAKEKAGKEKETTQCLSISRGCSRR